MARYLKLKQNSDFVYLCFVHQVEVVYRCTTCCKVFDTKKKLSRHEVYHEKKFTCPYKDCAKGFGRQENLKDHINVHTGIVTPCININTDTVKPTPIPI